MDQVLTSPILPSFLRETLPSIPNPATLATHSVNKLSRLFSSFSQEAWESKRRLLHSLENLMEKLETVGDLASHVGSTPDPWIITSLVDHGETVSVSKGLLGLALVAMGYQEPRIEYELRDRIQDLHFLLIVWLLSLLRLLILLRHCVTWNTLLRPTDKLLYRMPLAFRPLFLLQVHNIHRTIYRLILRERRCIHARSTRTTLWDSKWQHC